MMTTATTNAATPSPTTQSQDALLEQIRRYWNEHIHDLAIATVPIGTPPFFDELASYRFDKLRYLPQVVDFTAYAGQRLLEVGCGAGIDLVCFARGGAIVTGIDLAEVSIDLAKQNFAHRELTGDFVVMNGEQLRFADNSFDAVYAHGVLQYTANAQQMVNELYRVLRPGGTAIFMVYNKYSWLNALSKLMKVELEHEDAPVLKKYSIGEFKRLLAPFARARIVPERFPVRTKLHHGLKARLYNDLFVGAFTRLPTALVRPLGWHLMAFAQK
ncbi:MAG: class I SAM-dependent methyltransferase [Caldilineaceae bacterium]|nr:class I SAM-dependent methyltransferase [Caldilineaceae bacterium]